MKEKFKDQLSEIKKMSKESIETFVKYLKDKHPSKIARPRDACKAKSDKKRLLFAIFNYHTDR